jgi:hypothetical protein
MGFGPNMSDWLTREQIDQVVETISAGDLIEASDKQGAKLIGAAFDSAAARLKIGSNGTAASMHVKASDMQYMAEGVGGVINVDSPLSEGTSRLPDLPDSGE